MMADPTTRERLSAIDALRGIAALMVVFFHLQGAFARAPQPWMSDLLAHAFSKGHYGVNVFFVLSGFVIAYSLRDARPTWSYFARFVFRRSVRLDIPLWCTIIAETGLVLLSLHFFASQTKASLPTLPQLLANATYTQEFLGYPHITPVLWTLCFEIQFYFVLVATLVLKQRLAARTTQRFARIATAVLFAAGFFVSLLARNHVFEVGPGWALIRWNEFALGVLTYWGVRGSTARVAWPLACLAILTAGVYRRDLGEALVSVTTAMVCAACIVAPTLNRLLDKPVLQWLGRVSYSMYLIHGSVGYRTVSLGQYIWGPSLGPISGPLLWLFSLTIALTASAVLYWLVERPSLLLSRRVQLYPDQGGQEPREASC